jgi:hypothetical protein
MNKKRFSKQERWSNKLMSISQLITQTSYINKKPSATFSKNKNVTFCNLGFAKHLTHAWFNKQEYVDNLSNTFETGVAYNLSHCS